MNDKILDEIRSKDYAQIEKKIGSFLTEELSARDSHGVILGLSGGIDSTVLATLCAKLLKKKTLAVLMPNSRITPSGDTEDAIKIVDKLNLEYKLIDIDFIQKEFTKYLEPNPLALGNLNARIRSSILYYYANARNYLVLGTSNKSEFLIGYFTKYGDGAADILPLVSLYKTQVRELAKFLGIPDNIITKPSGPHLWEGHTAKTELGMAYEDIDSILYCMLDRGMTLEDTAKVTSIAISEVDKIYQMHKRSEHKRTLPKQCL